MDLYDPVADPLDEMFEAFDRRPGWHDRAACRAHPFPERWYPERGDLLAEARSVCRGCAVQQECLEFALVNSEKFGIWGGLSERERRVLRRAARGVAVPGTAA